MLSTIGGLAIILANAPLLATTPNPPRPAEIPHVDLDFNTMGAKDWKGKRFNEIVPSDQIQQIVRLSEKGFARDIVPSGVQAAYDALLNHLLKSPVSATDWMLADNERPLAELLVLTRDGRLLHIEVIGGVGIPESPTAILIHGKGRGARINVKDFQHPERRK